MIASPSNRFSFLVNASVLMVFALGSVNGVAQTITEIPSPRADGRKDWVVDMTGQLSPESITHINTVCDEVHQKIGRELCVVVISTTGGRPILEYGTDLFNHFGVGKRGFAGMFRDEGILLLAALDDRRATIVLGRGIDDDRKVTTAQQIIDDVVVPNFIANDPNSAMYEGIRTCATRLLAVSDLDSPDLLPSLAASGKGSRAIVRQHKRRGLISWWPWFLGFGCVGTVLAIVSGRYYLRYRPRSCPKCQHDMVLLEEDQDDHFLDDPEQIEERLGSVDYDVWACLPCDEVLKIRYGSLFTRYSKCPECWYVTVHKIEAVLVPATLTHGGRVRVVEDCKSCSFHRSYHYYTPKIVKSTQSSGSGFGGGGGGSGFGGGRSAGRGASGGW
jgi:uncharacterized protein